MQTYEIQGGQPVIGQIQCLGAKNFVSKAMVAACLGNSPTELSNVPRIGDVEITADLLRAIGAEVTWSDDTTLRIDPTTIDHNRVTMADSRQNRIPILLIPGLLHRFQKAEVPRLGGCNIGQRNVDFHLNAMRLFGGEVEERRDGFKATVRKRLQSAHYELPYPSVGATETCLFLSVLAEGTTVLRNVALEPEIMELVAMLTAMGAKIFHRGGRELVIEGVEQLHGTHYYAIGDRIEAASWACLAAATNGELTIKGVSATTLGNFLPHFTKVGGGFEVLAGRTIKFYRARALTPSMLETDVYPGFSTDWQQPFTVLLTQADGISAVHETVYENRFGYTKVLNELGANIQLSDQCIGQRCRFADKGFAHSAMIYGKTPLKASAEPLEVPDLRAGLAYVIAAALAEGTTLLTSIERIERGYGNLATRLTETNLRIKKSEITGNKAKNGVVSRLFGT